MGLLDHGAGDNGAVLQHVLQIHQIAVVHMLGIVIAVVEMDNTLTVCLHHIPGQQNTLTQIAADLTGHIVALGGVDHRVLVGVLLLGLFVVALDQRQNLVIGGVGFAHQAAGVAIGDIVLGHFEGAVRHDLVLHHILDFLHGGGTVHPLALQLNRLGDPLDLNRGHAIHIFHGVVRLGDSDDNFGNIKYDLRAISLDNFHTSSLPYCPRQSFVNLKALAFIITYILGFCKSTLTKYRGRSNKIYG